MSRAGIARQDVRDPSLEAHLKTYLTGCCFGETLHAFACVDSTMELAHALAASGVREGTLVWAAQQRQGRGRLGRSWNSPLGGAYFSFILRPTRPITEVPQLSLVVGLAAAETIQQLAGLFAAIRWPNDLLINGRKVAGILVEAKNSAVIVGVGLNVTTDPTQLPETATSLVACEPCGSVTQGAIPSEPARASRGTDPFALTAELCRRFDAWYDVWTGKGFAPIREALRPWMGMFGQPVRVVTATLSPQSTVDGPQQSSFEGIAQDVDEQGRLVVRLDSGLLHAFDVGEVALLR